MVVVNTVTEAKASLSELIEKVLFWWLTDDASLGEDARTAIADANNLTQER